MGDENEMNERIVTEMERNNKTTMLAHMIASLVYIITFVGEMAVGNRGIVYTLMIVILALGPVIAEFFFWKKDRESVMIKHLVAIGFAVLYTFVMFTTTDSLIYVYVIPMVLIISVYNDSIYALKISIGIVIENLIIAIAGAATGAFGYHDAGAAAIQVVVIIFVAVCAYFTSNALDKNNRQKMEHIVEAKKDTEAAMQDIQELSGKMKTGIDDIHTRVSALSQSSENTKSAMAQVTAGVTDTAEAVQRQLEQTEEIQQKVVRVDETANEMKASMQHTLEVLENGKHDIDVLVDEVQESVQKGADVAAQLENLDGYINQMNSIVELIGGITSQTSQLALNASIEAARAGEAGRGFSVVATEISGMAVQTKDATVHIAELIENVSGAITTVVTMVREMIDEINEEKNSTEHTADSFGQIRENTFVMRNNIDQLTADIEQMAQANREVAESVQTISAASEEVSAHANETLEAEERNMENLQKIMDRATELIQLTERG